MSNPFNVLNPINDIQNMGRMLFRANNPMQVFNQFAMQNPQMQPIVQALNNGANPQILFNNLCQQRGINPQQFINNLIGSNQFSRG